MTNSTEIVRVLNKLVAHYGFQHWCESDDRLGDCLSMILIQRTTEKNAQKALENLTPYLTIEKLEKLSIEKLQKLIYPAGCYQQKSVYIKDFLYWFQKHGGEFKKFDQWSTTKLRKELLTIKGIGSETVDVLLHYIFERNVFVADEYARRLFTRLGFGSYTNYEKMRKEFMPITKHTPYLLCKEWHAAIDQHGKHYRMNKKMDESWLLEQ